MSPVLRWAITLVVGAVLVGAALTSIWGGLYGYTLFIVLPMLIGAVSSFMMQPQTAGQAAKYGAVVLGCMTCSLILVGLEGVFCIAMTLPLSMPLGALGACVAFHMMSWARARSGGVALLMLLPAVSVPIDVTARPDLYEVRTAVEIAAPPEKIWPHVVSFSKLPAPDEWYFRSGIAYPIRARIEGAGVGAIRYCEFSTGPFVEPIQVWDEPRLLRFAVTKSPAPMNELSPYADLVPGHLHGYFTSRQGQFHLTPLPGGRTLLEGTTWYRHGLWPGQYWRWWSDAIIHRIHLRVLNHIRGLAE